MHSIATRPVVFLEHFAGANGQNYPRVRLEPLPFRIGRGNGCHYIVTTTEVSKTHAEFYTQDGVLFLRDLGSTNGTFVNGNRIGESKVTANDVIHLATEEFHLTMSYGSAAGHEMCFTQPRSNIVRGSAGRNRLFMQEMLSGYCGRAIFQPIVNLRSGAVTGYEALGRGTHEHLVALPTELFAIAERRGMASHLSEMFRRLAMEEATVLPATCKIFLNLHPFEINQDGLSQNLRTSLKECSLRDRLVLELNEEAILSLPLMRLVHGQIRDLGLQIAYDDFGAGQARLIELSECPPDFLKLDMALIRDIHLSPNRHGLVRAIIDTCQELHVQTIAEGVESQDEADMCKSFGCHAAQGYFFARPDAAPSFLDTVKILSGSTQDCPLIQ